MRQRADGKVRSCGRLAMRACACTAQQVCRLRARNKQGRKQSPEASRDLSMPRAGLAGCLLVVRACACLLGMLVLVLVVGLCEWNGMEVSMGSASLQRR